MSSKRTETGRIEQDKKKTTNSQGFSRRLKNRCAVMAGKLTGPFKQLGSIPVREQIGQANSPFYKVVFILLIGILCILMPFMSLKVGISGDEFTQKEWSEHILNYYLDGDDTATTPQPNTYMELYGSSFDTFATLMEKITGTSSPYELRHILNAFVGLLILLFTGLLVKRLSNVRMAALAVLLLFFTPRFLGHSLNNPKDIPFALGYIMSVYYIIRLHDYTTFKKRIALMLILSLGFSLSIRVGAFLNFVFLFFYAFLFHVQQYGWKEAFKGEAFSKGLKWTLKLILISGLAYFVGILAWPWALQDPLSNPMAAFTQFSAFPTSIRQLFEGQNEMSGLLPRYYILKYLWITTPVIILGGFLLSILLAFVFFKKLQQKAALFFVFFATIFPVFYIYYKHANVYGGMRHVMFVIPLMAVLAVLGFYWALQFFAKNKAMRYGLILLVGLGMSLPALFILRNHPYEYIYFNELIGGIQGAYGDYETDYYQISHKEASNWLIDYVRKNDNREQIKVGTNFGKASQYYFRNTPNIIPSYTRYYEKSGKDFDYFIFNNVYINSYQLKNNLFPPFGTIHTIEVDGKPICAIVKKQSKEDVLGIKAIEANQIDSAIAHFDRYLRIDTSNDEIHLKLADLYLASNNANKAMYHAEKAVRFNRDQPNALLTLGRVQLATQHFDEALANFNEIKQKAPDYFVPYYFSALCLFNKGDLPNAIQEVNNTLQLNPQFREAYFLLGNIYQAQGNTAEAQRVLQYAQSLPAQ